MFLWTLTWLGCTADDPPSGSAPGYPPPGPLQVGVARVRMPVPLGIGTVGYGSIGVAADPTPFADLYPGTTRIHDHPDFRAFVLSRGPGHEIVLLRSDTIGVFQHLRRAVLDELEVRLGRDLDHALIVAGTHTHSGPGRLIDAGGPFELIADRFFPEFYEGMVDAMADAVELAYADLGPGRIGIGATVEDEGHDDRRCEDGQTHENGALKVLALERGGELVGLVTSWAVHGTVLDIDDLTLSQDVSGGIEQAVADRLDRPVVVAAFNAWAGDVSPSDPAVPEQVGAPAQPGYDQMERVGVVVADAVEAALPGLTWHEEPELSSTTVRVPLDRAAIGYADGEFPYEYGGVYCSGPSDCDPATEVSGLDHACVPFPAAYPAPNLTEITAGHIGDLPFVTFPGEAGTLLAESVLAEIGEPDALFVGYAQDYTGYSLLPDDWWQGGYEASGALWGPRQGEYLAGRVAAAFRAAHGEEELPAGPPPVLPFTAGSYAPYVAPEALSFGGILADVPAEVGPMDEVVFTVAGHDPWFGAPLATLVHDDGSPVLRPNGAPVDSDGQAFWVELRPDPPYAEELEAGARTFQWDFHLPVRHAVVGAVPELAGSYRIAVALPDGLGGEQIVESSAFLVTP